MDLITLSDFSVSDLALSALSASNLAPGAALHVHKASGPQSTSFAYKLPSAGGDKCVGISQPREAGRDMTDCSDEAILYKHAFFQCCSCQAFFVKCRAHVKYCANDSTKTGTNDGDVRGALSCKKRLLLQQAYREKDFLQGIEQHVFGMCHCADTLLEQTFLIRFTTH
jgi:hypothetical protein